MHIEELLDEIVETVDSGLNLKLFHKRIVNGDKVIELSDEIRTSLPPEFESAKKITANRNKIIDSAEQFAQSKKAAAEKEGAAMLESARLKAQEMLGDAKAKAERIVENAQLHAEQLVSDSSITKTANERASQLLAETNNDCEAMMKATKADCDEMTAKAKQWSDDVRNAAYEYAMRMVGEVDNFLSASSSDLRQTKGKLESMQ
ncbi:MAG: hypothetical protein ACI4GA_00990 [Acutalibacteraceae bacterium]